MNSQVFGYEKQKKFFTQLARRRQLSHAYILSGPDMIGKRSFAILLARELMSATEEHLPESEFVVAQSESESGQTIPISSIRKVKDRLYRTTEVGAIKTMIIDNAHVMTVEAQNAILKILEEPPAHSILFLITSHPSLLLDTIQSRCQEIVFPTVHKAVFLQAISDAKLSEQQLDFLYMFTGGRIGLALQLIRSDRLVDIKSHIETFANLSNAPIYDRLDQISILVKSFERTELQRMVLHWMLYLHGKTSSGGKYRTLASLQLLHATLDNPSYNAQLAFERLALAL